ncbi:MAG: carboxypeptidase M32 [Pirellulales bacterium]|nr:carboxypeptidase M32 [Pirellulales bacterium]
MPVDPKRFESICQHARQAMLLHSTADALEWDERTGMPVAAGEYRAQQVATLRASVHRLRTDDAYGDDLQRLAEDVQDEDPHGDVSACVLGLLRDWRRDRKLPTDLVQKISVATVRGQQNWDTARQDDDYAMFRPALEDIVDLKREAGQRMAEGTDHSAYEALMDEYEPGAKVGQLQSMFDSVRTPLVDLIAAVREAPKQPAGEVLTKVFSMDSQRDFSHRVADSIGFDFERGRLDETSHPFCTTLGPHDCRILTRYDPHWLPAGLFGTMHEAGHGMYEQGLRTEWFGLPPGSYVSLGIHESQSRLWENQVGRSRSFWQWLYPQAQQTFTPELDDVSLETFYFAVNTVLPSLIRVEADEATYNLHIIIRFDLERQLIDGTLPLADLPEAWNNRYESDLGIRPPCDAQGVLQDVHWSAGLFGYFPTYTIGNLAAAQLFDAACKQLGDLDEAFSQGEFRPLLIWLREHVHYYGRCYSGAELVRRATGRELSADSLIRYLKGKLEPLYEL